MGCGSSKSISEPVNFDDKEWKELTTTSPQQFEPSKLNGTQSQQSTSTKASDSSRTSTTSTQSSCRVWLPVQNSDENVIVYLSCSCGDSAVTSLAGTKNSEGCFEGLVSMDILDADMTLILKLKNESEIVEPNGGELKGKLSRSGNKLTYTPSSGKGAWSICSYKNGKCYLFKEAPPMQDAPEGGQLACHGQLMPRGKLTWDCSIKLSPESLEEVNAPVLAFLMMLQRSKTLAAQEMMMV